MVGTYAAVLVVCGASLAVGQAAIALCGAREWSWLSPAVGLALLGAVCWATVRLPGEGAVSAVAAALLAVASVGYLRGRLEGGREALLAGMPVALLALVAVSLPFLVEGHFGVLGTGFNPDMSQHLLAADRLAAGEGGQLLSQGYPLGPHAVAVALHEALGVGFVQAFTGLTVAIAVLSCLTVLTGFRDQPARLRVPAALVVGLAYLVASYFAQGAFKETAQALFFLAFALALREATTNPAWRNLPLRFTPAALLAAGSTYAYSFPSLIWLLGTAAVWALAEHAVRRSRPSAGGADAGGPRTEAKPPPAGSPAVATGPAAEGSRPTAGPASSGPAPTAWRPVLYASLLFLVLVAPEIGRMIDFQRFETFDPAGPGLGNLFGQISPLEALGVWPTGDFRLSPGDGAVPAFAFWAGAAFAAILLAYGALFAWRGRETAILAALAVAVFAYVAARAAGTPYTAAKALEVSAPAAALVIVLPLLRRPVAWLYMLLAGACSLLALANAPVGPSSYSPALTGLRGSVGASPTLVLAARQLLEEEHGAPWVAWELRGGRVCIEPSDEAGAEPPPGVRYVVTELAVAGPPFSGFRPERVAPPYLLWEASGRIAARSPCPLIAVRQARQAHPR